MATMTRAALATRSIAPPIPFTIFPGIVQLARSPRQETCMAPRMLIFICPPRIMAKDSSLEKKLEPGRTVTGCLPALIRSGSSSLRKRRRSNSQQTILRLQNDFDSRRHAGRDGGGQADAKIDIEAVLQFPGNPPCDKLFTVHLDTPPRYSVRDRNISATGLSHQK